MQYQDTKTLFQLQTDLIDAKVELSVNKAIAQVVEQIINFRQEVQRDFDGLKHQMNHEIHGLRTELHKEMNSLKQEMGQRLSAVETALGMRNQVRGELRTRFFDYTFRAGWAIGLVTLSAAVSSLVVVLHSML